MKIYQQEILDGVADAVQATASIAYCSPAVICQTAHQHSSDFVEKIKASSANPKQIDLYYIKSVLVSTGWNKNDDVFSSQATWAARNTPEDKQFNFMHNENDIIGHITGSYVVDRNGNKIADDAEMPEEFDIITEAVLYNSWTNPENRQRMNQIIDEIEQNKWFVSMECLFAGFDYAVVDPQGTKKVIARDEKSSFLTKHLRAYGGTGEYEGYKIGRSLRDISFSGKGLVSKPANPRSIILDASKAFSLNETNVITSVSKGDINMSDNNLLEKQLAEVRSELASAKEENKIVRAEVEAAKDKEYADTIAALETSLAEKEVAFKALEETVQANEAALTELKEALAAKQAELEAAQSEMMDMKKKEKMAKRKASLVEAGFEDAEAEESLSLYETLEDSAFDSIVAMYKKKMANMHSKKEEMMKKEEMKKEKAEDASESAEKVEETVAEEEVSEELFDGVKSTEATLIDASDDNDELEATRASVAQWLTENVLRK